MYQQTWYAAINNLPRLETYCLFKHYFTFNSYLDSIQDKKIQNIFRISCHDLAFEIGRPANV